MNQCYDQFFPTEFLMDYMESSSNAKNRFLTYVTFRFLSAIAKEDTSIPAKLNSELAYTVTSSDFSKITDFLAEDFYFSPSLQENSFDPYLLLCAIHMTEDATGKSSLVFEQLLSTTCPQIASTDFDEANLDFDYLIQTEADFYAALYQVFTKHQISFEELLPKFASRYWPDLHFTCEDFVLYDFMNEYFGTKNCLSNENFLELIDTLVQATLNYNNSTISTLAIADGAACLSGTSSRFAGTKRFGSVTIADAFGTEELEEILTELFRYAAAYELRNNLFDFHLDEDKLITLDNWKEKLHWHYVQYSNVYELALSSFYTACLSRRLLKMEFERNLKELKIN